MITISEPPDAYASVGEIDAMVEKKKKALDDSVGVKTAMLHVVDAFDLLVAHSDPSPPVLILFSTQRSSQLCSVQLQWRNLTIDKSVEIPSAVNAELILLPGLSTPNDGLTHSIRQAMEAFSLHASISTRTVTMLVIPISPARKLHM